MMTTSSPSSTRPIWSSCSSTWRTISSVCSTIWVLNVSTPHDRESCERTCPSGVKARIGIGPRSRDIRRAESPVLVNATTYFAPTRSATSSAAFAITPLRVCGSQAIENLDEVIAAFDGFMVARGDLAVECPLEDVPFLQKQVVQKARLNAKPVIVATQMLESMISSPAPTRAEASDVANAVLDGADAVMLSGETSVGEFPIETVRTMARIISSTEAHELHHMAAIDWQPKTRGGVIAKAAAEVGERVGAKYLVAFTQSGDSARRLARYRGKIPVLAFTPEHIVRSQLTLTWGVETFLTSSVEHTDEMVRQVDEQLLKIGRVQEGDLVVIIAGSPPGIPGSTNALRIHRMGDAINEVAPAYRSHG